MGKLRILAGAEVCKILAEHGFVAVRQRGSHCILQLRTGETTVTVPVPLHNTIQRGTLLSIIRQSGLAKSLFEHE